MDKKVLLLLAQGFEAYEASVFTDVFGWSQVVGDVPVVVETAGRRPEIQCKWNFRVLPEVWVSEVNVMAYDALAIPGGFKRAGFFEDAFNDDFLTLIRQFHDSGKPIAAVCVASLVLGKCGILKGKKATTYHLMNGILRKELAGYGADVQDAHIVMEGPIITSSSPATALEVAFKLLELLTTRDQCKKVKEAMGF